GAAVIMAHRPSAISVCDRVVRLERGRVVAVGPRDEMLGPLSDRPAEGAAGRSLVAAQLAAAQTIAAPTPTSPATKDEESTR
ncbi:MAG: hypothetical protein AAF909_09180, partial [Pseudomonadota bacterium]